MPELIFFMALLIGVISVINGAVARARQRAEDSARAGRIRLAVRSGPPAAQHSPERGRPAGTAPPPRMRAGMPPGAPLQLRRSDGGERVRANLGRIFREEERLLAAFIFHEIMGPPRSLRRISKPGARHLK